MAGIRNVLRVLVRKGQICALNFVFLSLHAPGPLYSLLGSSTGLASFSTDHPRAADDRYVATTHL